MKTYATNRGVNRPMEFRGLQAQYIFWLVGVVLGDLLLFAALHLCGLSSWVCLPVVLGLGGAGITWVYRLCKRYRRYGLMKRRAARRLPTALRSRSRAIFQQSNSNHGKRTE